MPNIFVFEFRILGAELFTVLFNPEQYTLDRKNNFAQITVHGLSSPLLQFSHGELKTLQMELFFDSREKHEVNYVEVPGLNHFWAVDAKINEQIWEFFEKHPLK